MSKTDFLSPRSSWSSVEDGGRCYRLLQRGVCRASRHALAVSPWTLWESIKKVYQMRSMDISRLRKNRRSVTSSFP